MNPLKITVAGMWHLGPVIAACLSRFHIVTGYDPDAEVVAQMERGYPPVAERGLKARMRAHPIPYTSDPVTAGLGASILWLTFEPEIDNHDRIDLGSMLNKIEKICLQAKKGCVVILSSQMPVGTCDKLKLSFPDLRFACIPENLRLGDALNRFDNQEFTVIGTEDDECFRIVDDVMNYFSQIRVRVSCVTAEMFKHTLNTYLAMNIAFANEIANICGAFKADAREIMKILKLDFRVGGDAYLRPGSAYAGGTLAREVFSLIVASDKMLVKSPLIDSIRASNNRHKSWPMRVLIRAVDHLPSKRVAVLGLSYTDTNTLRRSASLELIEDMYELGYSVVAYDPDVLSVQQNSRFTMKQGVAEACKLVDAVVVMKDHAQFRDAPWNLIEPTTVIDPNHFLTLPKFHTHITVGGPE